MSWRGFFRIRNDRQYDLICNLEDTAASRDFASNLKTFQDNEDISMQDATDPGGFEVDANAVSKHDVCLSQGQRHGVAIHLGLIDHTIVITLNDSGKHPSALPSQSWKHILKQSCDILSSLTTCEIHIR